MKDINIVIDSQTHKVQFPDNFLGLNAENLQGNINFTFTNGFVNGIARLELSIDCESGFIPNLQNTGDSYTLPILSSLLTSDNIVMQLVIEQTDLITYKLTTDTSINNQKTYYTRSGVEGEYVYTIVENPKVADIGTYYEAQIPIFKTHIFNMTVGESINAVNTIPDDYPTWIDTLNSLVGQVNAKIIEMNQALAEVDNLDITATKEGTTVTITITRKDGSKQVVTITDGKDGVGIEKIEKTDTTGLIDTYTIYYTDDSTSTFQVKNGRGIVSIDKTNTNILTDTYTITYNDDTTSTFYVVNGNGVESIEKTGTSGLIDTYRISYTNGEYYDYQVANGNGIDNIEKTSTSGLVDTYTITYTNGTTSTYIITNGNGISNIAKTSTVDNVDTYTIYYTNGTTSTFTVTNSTVTNQEFQELQRLVDYNALYSNALIKMNNTGTDLTINDTAETPMPMTLSPSELEQRNLPIEYTQVDYIQSSGTQYIDTGVKASSNLKIDTNIEIITDTTNIAFFGGRDANIGYQPNNSNMLFYIYNNNAFRSDYYNTQTLSENIQNILTKWHIVKNRNILSANSIDNQSYEITSDTANFTSSYNMYIFTGNNAGNLLNVSPFRLYDFKMYDNNVLIRNFIPCYRNSDNEVGLYDLVNNVFYTNAGTGSFTYGSVVTQPTPDYPQTIHTISGNNEIRVGNKNLFNPNDIVNGYIDDSDGTIKGDSKSKSTNYIEIDSNDDYYIPYVKTSGNWGAWYDSNKNYISGFGITSSSQIKTSPNNAKYLRFTVSYNENHLNYAEDTMIAKSNEILAYVPHQEQSLPLNLPVENLLNYNDFIAATPSSIITIINNGINIKNTTGGYAGKIIVSNLKANTNYYLSYIWNNISNGINAVAVYADTVTTTLIKESYNSNGFTFNTGENTTINIWFYASSGTQAEVEYTNMQLEKGTKANSYTPYGTTPLEYCKIGDYEDEFVYNTTDTSLELNKWYLKKNIGKVVLNGSEDYTEWGTAPNWNGAYIINPVSYNASNGNDIRGISNYFPVGVGTGSFSTVDGIGFRQSDNQKIWYFMLKHNFNSLAEFKTWLSTHNTIVDYVLDSPEYILLNDTLQSQLTEIYKWVKAYQEQTNISQVNNDLPFIINTITCYDLNKLLTRVEVLESEV